MQMPERGRILDLGCGANDALARYRSPDREIWGADFDTHSLMSHPEWFKRLGPGGEIPFPDSSLDLVVAIMVMEHVSSPNTFMLEVARVLRPGGRFVGHTISGSHYVTWLRRIVGLAPHGFTQWLVRRLYGRREEDTFPTCYKLNSKRQLEEASRVAGLLDPEITRYADPGYFNFSKTLQKGAIVLDWLLERVAPGWGRLYFTVVVTKPGDSKVMPKAA